MIGIPKSLADGPCLADRAKDALDTLKRIEAACPNILMLSADLVALAGELRAEFARMQALHDEMQAMVREARSREGGQ